MSCPPSVTSPFTPTPIPPVLHPHRTGPHVARQQGLYPPPSRRRTQSEKFPGAGLGSGLVSQVARSSDKYCQFNMPIGMLGSWVAHDRLPKRRVPIVKPVKTDGGPTSDSSSADMSSPATSTSLSPLPTPVSATGDSYFTMSSSSFASSLASNLADNRAIERRIHCHGIVLTPSQSKSEDEQPKRSEQLDRSPYRQSRTVGMDRASHSAESVLAFMHPAPSESSLAVSVASDRPRGHSPKEQTMKPASQRRVQHRRRKSDNFSPFPYFATPLVFSSVNPHLAMVPTLPPVAESSSNPKPKPKNKEKMRPKTASAAERAPLPAPPEPTARALDDTQLPSHSSSLSRINLKWMVPSKRLFGRQTNDTASLHSLHSHPEDPDAHLLPRIYSLPLTSNVNDDQEPSATARTAASVDPPQPSEGHDSPAPEPEDDRKVEIAILKVKGDVREESDLGEVIPRLRRLRAPTRRKL
ncbi:uncharacterized protein LAESUDRAFT_721882 [Laetiporus sulphureus 93-53]|uniref:Uncharacterized protein n=1 Tax=Laetiporus sulphureus 93-53 TaxID=1314785 RepID=A0A165GL81_9APHY|nr:uncharacterized protein LAESUDRAFT_721882 [Laetiporus sulphureus 93-53]KZT10505.1 hypothetical protein LAESUDRAFT_721882 [Laetiporus sulphureus 93-53]